MLLKTKKQGGFSITEVLVGMSVSLIAISAMTYLYQNQLRATFGEYGIKTIADKNIASMYAMNTINKKIQNSGFGIDANSSRDIALYNDVKMTTDRFFYSGDRVESFNLSHKGNLILWKEKIDDKNICVGFHSDIDTGALTYLTKNNCTSLNNLRNWTQVKIVDDNIINYPIVFSLSKKANGCSPYEFVTKDGLNNAGLVVNIWQYLNGKDYQNRVCLLNFVQ